MPVMDGMEVIRRMREACPIVAIVANSLIESEVLEAGASEVVIKPWNLDDLMDAVNRNLRTEECSPSP